MSSDRLEENQTRTGGKAATGGVIPGRFALSVGMPNSMPPAGWIWTPLSSVARLETGHTPSRKHPEYWEGDVPWVGIRDATGNHGATIHKTNQYTTPAGIANSSARVLPANTVCLSRTASVGYVVVMGVPMATSQDFVNWVCGPAIDYRFLKYVLLAEHDSMSRFSSGTTHQTIYFPEAKAFHVCLPSVAHQKGVADILQSLDDRITLLRETNATLEGIAQALFKSWFVDFDPVYAKQEGRMPSGMDEATAALFPDDFDEAEIGPVPRGWGAGTLANLADLNPESWTSKIRPETIQYVDLANAKGNEIDEVTFFAFDDAPSRARRVLRVGDTAVGTVRPGNRSFAYIYHATNNLTGSTGFAVLRPRDQNSKEFLFIAATRDASIEHLAHVADGGAYPAVRPEVVAGLKTVLPHRDVLDTFHALAGPIFLLVGENKSRVRTLTTLRDVLLPRLISGQLRLPEATDLMKHAA